ncbi:MAG: hypothetical protein D6788_05955, partial [Planctomycetota bacterium]
MRDLLPVDAGEDHVLQTLSLAENLMLLTVEWGDGIIDVYVVHVAAQSKTSSPTFEILTSVRATADGVKILSADNKRLRSLWTEAAGGSHRGNQTQLKKALTEEAGRLKPNVVYSKDELEKKAPTLLAFVRKTFERRGTTGVRSP